MRKILYCILFSALFVSCEEEFVESVLEIQVYDKEMKPVEDVDIRVYVKYSDYLNKQNLRSEGSTDKTGKVTFKGIHGVVYFYAEKGELSNANSIFGSLKNLHDSNYSKIVTIIE